MINAIGYSGTHKAPAGDLQPLVDQLAKRADTNRDGQVSNTEFSQFLATLMESLEAGAPPKVETSAPAEAPVTVSRER